WKAKLDRDYTAYIEGRAALERVEARIKCMERKSQDETIGGVSGATSSSNSHKTPKRSLGVTSVGSSSRGLTSIHEMPKWPLEIISTGGNNNSSSSSGPSSIHKIPKRPLVTRSSSSNRKIPKRQLVTVSRYSGKLIKNQIAGDNEEEEEEEVLIVIMCDGDSPNNNCSNSDSSSSSRFGNVWFNDSRNSVHYMTVWQYAYKQARKGEWEQLARDSVHFARRVEIVSKDISPILENEHRTFVFATRSYHNVPPSID
ncbi:hypothetical protein RI129_001189, partial [Pyrocoelia pectoralis]